ncbi:MAG: alpha/beta hydrolase [Gammaproteobacteria bacterium]|jgi:arylformamidase|nr:alpha/beta hydrolase [Gammaproteobacteria bacterium]MBT3723667.1 alpha/beta hydrolase [Gammaproteobacteria bacterium]MBT4194128.1 alpha/beta hydrolase [Gammaproteobacteria bacterium]MBT4450670.1 alpha/beta hydrolase [Gammaproteobacteria bacterium]MBT4859986.1 alpha/beta hydrolase [Gammaproteobacteria bacterium]
MNYRLGIWVCDVTEVVDPYLEQQYNNRLAVADFQKYLDSWRQHSEDFRLLQTIAHLNVSYGPSARQIMDIFPLQNQRNVPVHVFIHGGYWQALDKNSFSFMAEAFNRNGECAVILNYDLCPSVTMLEIISQVKRAIIWVKQNISAYGGDPERVQITGHSAGAHLLATLLTTDWSIVGLDKYPFQQLNGLSGLYDLQPLVPTSVNQALGLNTESAFQYSPLFEGLWKSGSDVKFNLLVGELESQEYKKQSTQLLDRWIGKLVIQSNEVSQSHHFSILEHFLMSYLKLELKN